MSKKTTWTRPRHAIIYWLAWWAPYLLAKIKYNVSIERFKEQGDRPYLILYNHQTPYDQFFISSSFRGAVYYVATEDIFSLGWVSKLISWLVAPIPIRKQTTDVQAVKNCIRVAKEGGTICIAPEGNRTYSGQTEYINPAIASLAKKLGLPIALFRIEGGYGKQPRWSDVIRKGKMRAYVSKVIEPEEYKDLKPDALCKMISDGLYVNEACADAAFEHPQRAEYLERAIYVCPFCGLSEFESSGHLVTCKKCGRQVNYELNKELKGVGFDFPFPFVLQWYEYQKKFINQLDTTLLTEEPLYRDTASISQVLVFDKKVPLREQAAITLYGDRIVFDEGKENELLLPFTEVSAVTVLGRNKLNIYHQDKMIYQLKGSKRFNALKYVNIYYRSKNISRGEPNGEFLGL